MDIVTFLLALGLAARLTRLVVDDTIFMPVKLWIYRHIRNDTALDWTVDLLSCPYCIGFWLSGLSVVTGYLWGHTAWWRIVAATFTISMLVAWLYVWVEPEE